MIRGVRLAGAVGTLVLAAGALLGTAAAPAVAQDGDGAEATLSATPRIAVPGAEVRIQGEGWPERELIVVEVCGNDALLGSPDCAQSTSRTISTDAAGRLSGMLTVPTPPVPCPCVVRAFLPADTAAATTPFDVTGHPIAPLREPAGPPPPPLELRATVEEVDGTGALFGAPAARVLHLAIENTSDAPVSRPRVLATWGRDAGGDGYIDVPPIDEIAPGETVALALPFELPTAAVGSYVVSGQVMGVDGTAFAVDTGAAPWGLLAVPGLLLVHLGASRLRRRLRRRIEVPRPVEPDEPALDLTDEIDLRDPVPEVVDLRDAVLDVIDLRDPVIDVIDLRDGAPGGRRAPGWPRPRPLRQDEVAAMEALLVEAERYDLRGTLFRAAAPAVEPTIRILPEELEELEELEDDEVDGDGGVLVGAPPRRRRTYAGLALALVAGTGLWSVRTIPTPAEPLAAEDLCEALVQLDVVDALAGNELQPRAVAVEQLAHLADRVPEQLRPALTVMAATVEARPALVGVSELDPDRSDAWNAAALAVYGLDLDGPFIEAATRVEKYAVEECGMTRSGRFDLDVSYAIDVPEVDLDIPEPEAPDLSEAVAGIRTRGREQIQEAPQVTLDLDAARADVEISEPPAVAFDIEELHERYG